MSKSDRRGKSSMRHGTILEELMRPTKQAAFVLTGLIAAASIPTQGAEQPPPRESHACCETKHDFVRMSDGSRLQTIVTRPREVAGRLPAILFVAWLSCDSVELQAGAEDGWSRFQRALVSDTGAVVMRVNKAGVGESDGVCAQTDFDTEVAGYRAAFDALKRMDGVDSGALAIVGASMGGAIAPLVAQGESLKAVAVWGTFAGTWLEHMLEHERRRLALAGAPPAVVNEKMRGLSELHARILFDRLLPRDVPESRPELRPLWYGEPEGLYGRPASFHQQVQAANLVAAWEKVQAPVLAVHGEFDWIMSRADHERIAEVVNRVRPGSARFVSIPRTNHHFWFFDSPETAFRQEGGRYSVEATQLIVQFVRAHPFPSARNQEEVPGLAASATRTGGDANLALFGRLVGDWDVEVTYQTPDGAQHAAGTWNFR
jgi:pimeloyl-ACP methyl ester carboxylesterase